MPTHFEDFSVGWTAEFGSYDVTEAEIREFAERYDPQWYHTDPERAREESMFGGLVASGWHTAAMAMRMLVDELFSETAALGSKGVDELRWHRPVRPGDTLSVRMEVVDTEADGPDRGLVTARVEVLDDEGEVVCSMLGETMYERRDAGSD